MRKALFLLAVSALTGITAVAVLVVGGVLADRDSVPAWGWAE